ncbi:MAG: hypothetical protein ACFFCC_15975 [Promethearchaeota archaeon]
MEKCNTCGMIRARKDLVLTEDGNYMCFSCWNKELKIEKEKSLQKTNN